MRSPLDSIAAAYVLLGLALLFFSAGFAWFLHEQGIRPIRRILRILEFPAFKVVFLLSLVAGVVHYAVSKEDGSPPQDDPPLFLSPRLSLGPRPEHLDPPDESLLPVWTNAVTNLLLTGIAMTTNGVALGAACPPSADYRSFDIWATADLSLPSWEIVGFSEFPSGVNRHEVLIPYDQLPPDFQERGFFGLEVSFDSDRDGLPDSVESALDTDPYDYDTDGDGLPDGVEASWIEVGAGELDGLPDGVGTEITASGQTSGLFPFDLPFPFRLAGENVTTAVVDLRGAVYLGGEGLTNGLAGVGISSMDGNSARDFATVAGYLTQLKMRQTLGSKIRFGTTGSDEELRFVVEFEHMGFVANATNEVSFRVVFYAARPDVVAVRYGTAFDSGRDEYTSIGARGGHDENGFNKPHLPVYYGKTPSVTEGDVYVYHFGMGGDPLLTDTDADDVDDGEEYENGTHPRRTDSDEDGLPDRWEIDYGLDPLSADGAQGAAGDFDADGVLNIEELAYDTDPSNADSDGDGLSDGEELGRIVRVASDWTVPYFTSTNLTANFSDPDDGFIGCRLPCGIRLQGEVVTNVIIDVNGILYFPRIGTAPSLSSLSSGTLYEDFGKDVFALAPLWQDLYLTTNAPAPYVRMFRTEGGTNDCVVIEYGQVCPYTNRSRTGTVSVASVQVLLPISGEGGIRVNYTDVEGPLVDGRLATIGFRGFGYGEPAAGLLAAPRPPRVNEPGDGWTNVYCDDERGAVTNGLSLLFLPGTGSDPNTSDTDGDGVSDLAETIYGSSAISSDTDRDGMPDPWEIHYEFDSADPSDAAHDEDEDGLTNVGEYQRGTNPINPDSDSDGLFDGLEIVHGTDPKRSDTDCDGLSDGDEVSLGANPLQPDTDGDGLDDGWEQRYDGAVVGSPGPQTTVPAGTSVPFDPTDDNRTDSDANNDPDADPDGDGLSNAEECSCGSNPCSPDTDNDGIADAEEVSQGSDPTDPTDGGNPNSRVAVSFCFGDHSGSHSEKYKLIVKPIDGRGTRPATFSRVNAQYGECETRTVCLKPGWSYEVRLFHSGTKENEETDYDYTLQLTGEVPANVIVVDEDSLFGIDETSDTFAGDGKVAMICVHTVTKVAVCKPNDQSWEELDVSRVVLDDEELRIKVEVAPQVNSLMQCCRMFGDTLIVKTSGTCPSGVSVPIGNDATMNNSADKSEIRITKTRQQLISLGLLPADNDDGVDEKSSYDVGDADIRHDSNISDSEAFQAMPLQFRGAANNDLTRGLESVTPVSRLSESFFKSAGVEFVKAEYAGELSDTVQIMNQADYFYISGHGHHINGQVDGYAPTALGDYWTRDLDCVIFACCSVLDIGNYNDVIYPSETTPDRSSPGKLWERVGPGVLLGYNASGPKDNGGAPARIMSSWLSQRAALGDVNAWMEANRVNRAWNACAIVKGRKYVYFRQDWLGLVKTKTVVEKGDW